ncbi:hypothetical protein HKI87_01g00430 [Chloropicon roscoffensis]|uniref:F-box domain-containing protein n=1 Tax=Chloropicon roscoffensis TaxID=1461544 RepID=A0AAX4NXM4_9CHLO
MVRGAEPAAKRAKVDKDVLRRNELIIGVTNARAKAKELVREAEEAGEKFVREARQSLAQQLPSVCAKLGAKNRKLLGKLFPDLWQKIIDEYLHQNDLLALAMTCRFFRDTTKDLGKKMKMDLTEEVLIELEESGKMASLPSHTSGWFRWVCDTFKILPGFGRWDRVKGAVYEGDLVNYAALQGSVKILRWLMEEKGWELNEATGWRAGMGGSIEVLEYMSGRGYEFDKGASIGAALTGRLEALQYLRSQDPPCPWDVWTCAWAAEGGHLEVLKWARSQDPPCPWDWRTCSQAAEGGHLDVLKWARSQDPPCPWSRSWCREAPFQLGHEHVVDWIDRQGDESDDDEEYSD